MALGPHQDERCMAITGDRGGAGGLPPDGSGPGRPRSWSLSWPPTEAADPQRLRGDSQPIDSILAEYSSRWQLGEMPSIEEYVARLGQAPTSDAAVLIYHAFC